MVNVVSDENDKVIAYMEWRQVCRSGFDKLGGEYIWINDLWIHRSHKNDFDMYRKLMRQVFFHTKDAKWLYFNRRKYDGRLSKLYTKEKIMNMLERDMVVV